MKSFDILVDGRLIQSDLIVVNLPVRNDIAAYYWLNIDSKLINHIIAEKAVSPVENAGGIALNANADSVVTKYEIIDAYPIALDANAEFNVLLPISMEDSVVEIQQGLQEVSQKFERASLPISIGVDDMLIIIPLKSSGNIKSAVELDVAASEIKNAIIGGTNSYNGLAAWASLSDPSAVYYEKIDSGIVLGADVRSLSHLLHLRLIQSNINIGVDSIDFDFYRSLGKLPARIATDVDAHFMAEFFNGAESEIELTASAATFPCKVVETASGVVLACTGSAVLRRMRLLSDVDAIGVLSDVDDMSLEDMYYADL